MKTKLEEGRVKRAFQDVKDGDCFLDVGTGIGQFVIIAAKKGAFALGVDISSIGCRIGKESSRCRGLNDTTSFIICEVENMPFRSKVFDLITCFEVLEHLENPEKCLREISRVLKKRGKVFLSTPHHFCINFRNVKHYTTLAYYIKRWCKLNLFGGEKELKKIILNPDLSIERWSEARNLDTGIDDACSLLILDVLHFLRKIGLKVCYFDTYAYEKDAYEMFRIPSKGSHLPYSLLRVFSNIPLLRYAGSSIYIEAIKS